MHLLNLPPLSVSCQTMPLSFTAVPGSQGPKVSGSVIVEASGWPPEVFPCNGEATEVGDEASLSTLPLDKSPLSCKSERIVGF